MRLKGSFSRAEERRRIRLREACTDRMPALTLNDQVPCHGRGSAEIATEFRITWLQIAGSRSIDRM